MIKDLFLPDQVKGYYLFAKRIIGFDIGKTHISATQVFLKGRNIVIEKYLEEKLDGGSNNNHERVVAAIKRIMAQVDSYDAVHTALSSSVIIFKELKLPFLDYDKINKVIRYEVEPLLPFSIHDATIDFIITKQYAEDSSSQLLVAAVQNQHIEQHIELFVSAGIMPSLITIDLFALYGFYNFIPQYAHLQGGAALIDLGMLTTRIAYIHDGQLRFIRTLNKGTSHIAKALSDALEMQSNEAMDNLIRYGLEKNNDSRYLMAINQIYATFWNDIQLTLQSFTTQAADQGIRNILLLGGGAEIKGVIEFVKSHVQVSCSMMHATDILYDPHISIKNKLVLPSSGIISLSTALPCPVTENFNLSPQQATRTESIKKQLITAAVLCILLLGALVINNFLQIRSLSNMATKSAQEALDALKDRKNFQEPLRDLFKPESIKKTERDAGRQKKLTQELLLTEAAYLATDAVKKQGEMWFAFSGGYRASFLTYLLELTNIIDKDALQFSLDSLTIAEGIMTLKGRVKNSEALKVLEKEIRSSKLFKLPESAEEPVFTLKIILTKP